MADVPVDPVSVALALAAAGRVLDPKETSTSHVVVSESNF